MTMLCILSEKSNVTFSTLERNSSDSFLKALMTTCLTAMSFFKSRKKGIDQRVMEIKQPLLPTSVTYSGESLSTAKIPNFFEIIKNNGQNLSEDDEFFRDGNDVSILLMASRLT